MFDQTLNQSLEGIPATEHPAEFDAWLCVQPEKRGSAQTMLCSDDPDSSFSTQQFLRSECESDGSS